MKHLLPLVTVVSATVFLFTACDEQKTEDAKTKTVEAAKSVGELAKDTGGKILEKTKEGARTVGEKLKGVKETVTTKASPAVEAFKTRLSGFSDMMKGMKAKPEDNPATIMSPLMAKLGTISTDGVPEDLAKPFQDYHASMRRVLQLSQSAPSDPKAYEKWQMDHAAELHKLEQDSTAALKALKASAAKYGLTDLYLGEDEE